MAKKPDAVFSSLWGGHFVTFAKQAKALKYFESLNSNFLGAGEAGAIETAKAMGDDYPFGVWANAYDAFNWEGGPPAHKEYIARYGDDMPEITGWRWGQEAASAGVRSTEADNV